MAEPSGEALDALARAISERLQAVVPEGASPNIAGDIWSQLDVVDQHGLGSFEDNFASVSVNILNDVQDQIMRDLKGGWSRAANGVPGEKDSGKDLPEVEAAVVSGELRFWYDDARRPALELPPIDLDELGVAVQ